MIDLDQVEFANEAFYLAFESKDYEAMAHLWCEASDPLCLHPGWPALHGRHQVMESWANILANPNQGQVSFFGAVISRVSETAALVMCYEQAGDNVMIATNLFIEEGDRPRLFSHQAGMCAHPPEPS